MTNIIQIRNISELHQLMGAEKPKHPLISVIDFSKIEPQQMPDNVRIVSSFYSIMMKTAKCGNMKYGRKNYDFQEGSLLCMAPDQILSAENTDKEQNENAQGWGLFFHQDLIRKSSLAKKIKDYTYFSYEANEALHLSDKEKNTLASIIERIEEEYSTNLDHFSHDVIISNLELLLNYCNRYYGRQFITRSSQNKDILSALEGLLSDYFSSDQAQINGIPTVKYCAEQLHFSANYLSDLVKKESGKSVQEHIHYHLIEKAKTELLNSENSVGEIAMHLGFEYPQYFSKIFKLKTGLSPVEYRSMN